MVRQLLCLSLALAHVGAAALPSAAQSAQNKTRLPHILFVIVDDFGWGNVGYHRSETTREVQTPHMDALVRDGVELNRHYVHWECTPSRSAFLTGRLPVHVVTQLPGPCDELGAIPRNMTGIAAVLKRAGYATHQVGKWDAGMTTPHHTPKGRGYDTSLTYFGHGNWMWTEAEWLGAKTVSKSFLDQGIVDFWDTDRPASHLNGTGYEEYIFRDRMLHILRNHDQSTPLFLHYNSKVAHYPIQAPVEYQKKFEFIDQDNRRVYAAMVNFLDDQLANITGTMKELGMWENTLMVLTSDNGGYVRELNGSCNTTSAEDEDPSSDVGHGTACFNGEAGANNYPLRGGKYSMFEGGVRVNAFASGGYLPERVRGTKLDGSIHIADWYRTLAEGIAGQDVTDHWAAASGLPPVDSLNIWPLLSGQNLTSPRDEVGILFEENIIMKGRWKYILGNTTITEAERGGPFYPNASTWSDPIIAHKFVCPAQGCLFDVVADPSEFHEVSAEYPTIVAELKEELAKQAKTIWKAPRREDPQCRATAMSFYGGFYGPWKEVDFTVEPQVEMIVV